MFSLIKSIFKKSNKVVETKQEARKRRKKEKKLAEWSMHMNECDDYYDNLHLEYGEAFNFHHDSGDR